MSYSSTETDYVNVVLLDERAKLPERHSEGAAGYDLHAIEDGIVSPGQVAHIRTGLLLKVPPYMYARVYGRSGLSLKFGMEILDSVALPGDEKELIVKVFNHGSAVFQYKSGDRVAQLIFNHACKANLISGAVNESIRGEKGFGSTGMN